MRRIACILVALTAVVPAAWGQTKFNVDVTVGWGGCYRPREWTPVDIDIHHKLTKPLGGVMRITAQQDGMTDMTVEREIVLTPGVSAPVPLVARFAYGAGELFARFVDEDGRMPWKRDISLGSYGGQGGGAVAIQSADTLIGLVGRSEFGIRELSKTCRSRYQSAVGKTYVCSKLPRLLPKDWTGYVSLDLLILYDPDWDQITVHQARAIAKWVHNGGRLLILLGTRPLPEDRELARLVPFQIGPAETVQLPSALLRTWGCRSGPIQLTGKVVRRALSGVGASARTVKDGSQRGETVFAWDLVGFGAVGVVPFNPTSVGGMQGKNVGPFWRDVITPLLARSTIEYSPREREEDYDRYYGEELGSSGQASNQIIEHLLSIPELRPLSIWWVIGLLTLLAVLIGPVDYLVLKRLGRLPLTWVTSSVCILIFSVGAYYGVQVVRSGAMQIRAVSVVDAVEGAPCAWSTTYVGIFAPASDDYRVQSPDGEPLRDDQWWSAVSPDLQQRFSSRSMEAATRHVYCVQQDVGNLPRSLPINIWSMQCLMAESPVEQLPLSATVHRDGAQVTVEITNHAPHDIQAGNVRMGTRGMFAFGRVPGGQTQTFTGTVTSKHKWDEYLAEGYEDYMGLTDAAEFAVGCERRTRAIAIHLARGAAVVSAVYEQPPVAFRVAGRRSNTDHVQLVRLVVTPANGETR
jgi:hypothetical protein